MKFEKKTIAILLVVVIGLSLSVGLASAAGENNPILAAINNAVTTLTSSISNALANINAHTDSAVTNLKPISLLVDKLITLPPNTIYNLGLLLGETGKTYSGHISIVCKSVGADFDATLCAGLPRRENARYDIAAGEGVDLDFASEGLFIELYSHEAIPIDVEIAAVIQYQISTNVRTLP